MPLPSKLVSLEDLDHDLKHRARTRIRTFFPDAGPLAREFYPKHVMFFTAGGRHKPLSSCPGDCNGEPHRERCFLAGNRTGKTVTGAYEMALHLTGDYPHWWPGARFKDPITAWAAGVTNEKVKEIVQKELFGALERDGLNPGPLGIGTGMIPGDRIVHTQMRPGTPNTIQQAWVKHRSGGRSMIELKSYEMGRKAFEGTTQNVIWLDEEPPLDVYTECLMRTMTIEGGIVYLTFTPLQGLSEVVLLFMPNGLIENQQQASSN